MNIKNETLRNIRSRDAYRFRVAHQHGSSNGRMAAKREIKEAAEKALCNFWIPQMFEAIQSVDPYEAEEWAEAFLEGKVDDVDATIEAINREGFLEGVGEGYEMRIYIY